MDHCDLCSGCFRIISLEQPGPSWTKTPSGETKQPHLRTTLSCRDLADEGGRQRRHSPSILANGINKFI